ncbi:MAG: Sugar transferase, partial [uncultured bacterium]
MLAPIIIFVYNRPKHVKETLESLMANDLADQSTLFVYADGPKEGITPENLEKIKKTREVIREKQWC